MSDAPTNDEPTVESHFFPLSNGLVYTYSRFDALRAENDTLRCRLHIGQTKLDSNLFFNLKTGDTVYHIGFDKDASGNEDAFLRFGDTTLLVLDGKLEQGATWVAEIHGIHATVIAHYDDYYLPGRQIHYPDVLLVKYQDLGNEKNYTLRFFARDHGLIREVSLIDDGSTEISSLQLLSIDSPH